MLETPAHTYPLSFGQEWWQILTTDGFAGNNNTVLQWRVDGPLDLAALELAACIMTKRHEVLRTAFILSDTDSWQDVRHGLEPVVTLTDLPAATPELEKEALLASIARRLAEVEFDLSEPPLLRLNILRIAVDEHVVQVLLPRIITDPQTVNIITSEIRTIYDSVTKAEVPALAPLETSFGQLARAERDRFASGGYEESANFWRKSLSLGSPPVGIVAAGRADHNRAECECVSSKLDEEVAAALHAAARSAGVTPYMTYLAALKVLLSLATGRKDIAIGTALANRQPGGEGVVACFANPVVIHTDIPAKSCGTEALKCVRASTLQVLARQDIPFLALLRSLRSDGSIPLGKSECDHDLYRVGFAFHEGGAGVKGGETGGTEWSPFKPPGSVHESMRAQLKVTISASRDHSEAWFVYRSDICGRSVVEELMGGFRGVLAQMAADSERAITYAAT